MAKKLTKKQLQRLEELKSFHRKMKKQGREVDVKRWTLLAYKHMKNKKKRDRFIQLLDVFAIDIELLTHEELWFLDNGIEFIDSMEKLEIMDNYDI